MMYLANDGANPPGCWWYEVPETGKRIPASGQMISLSRLRAAVADHYTANGYAVPANLRLTLMDWCCRHAIDPTGCLDSDKVPAVPDPARQVTRHQISQALATMASWGIRGFPTIPVEMVEKRTAICLMCTMHRDLTGCKGCGKAALDQMVTKLLGSNVADERLQGCGVCGCLLKVKVRIPHHILWSHTPDKQREQYPPNCWLVQEATDVL